MRRGKYGNVRTTVDGISFHSRKEAARYIELKLLQRAKKIKDLKLQPSFNLHVNDVLICRYIADFQYRENGKDVIEDVKGVRTSSYIIKRKLMRALLKIDVLET